MTMRRIHCWRWASPKHQGGAAPPVLQIWTWWGHCLSVAAIPGDTTMSTGCSEARLQDHRPSPVKQPWIKGFLFYEAWGSCHKVCPWIGYLKFVSRVSACVSKADQLLISVCNNSQALFPIVNLSTWDETCFSANNVNAEPNSLLNSWFATPWSYVCRDDFWQRNEQSRLQFLRSWKHTQIFECLSWERGQACAL